MAARAVIFHYTFVLLQSLPYTFSLLQIVWGGLDVANLSSVQLCLSP